MNRNRRGGKAIAVGADGCIFDGEFSPDGVFTKTPSTVTKIFAGDRVSVAQEEYQMMKKVKKATCGDGVVVAIREPITISRIPEEAWEGDQIKDKAGCKRVLESSPPYIGLVTLRIRGSLLNIMDQIPLPESMFDLVESALTDMRLKRIVHMDLAPRNIFYTAQDGKVTALLGDFGNTIILDESIDKSIQGYLEKYKIRGNVDAIMRNDSIHPVALLLMIGYDVVLQGEAEYTAFKKRVDVGMYLQILTGITRNTYVYRRLHRKASKESISIFINFATQLETNIGYILKFLAGPDQTYEKLQSFLPQIRSKLMSLLMESDRKMMSVIKLDYSADDNDATAEQLQAVYTTWFGDIGKRGGAVQPVGSVEPVKTYASLEEALQSPIPPLPKGNSVTLPEIVTLGGRVRKLRTRRNRKHRVKISRKHK